MFISAYLVFPVPTQRAAHSRCLLHVVQWINECILNRYDQKANKSLYGQQRQQACKANGNPGNQLQAIFWLNSLPTEALTHWQHGSEGGPDKIWVHNEVLSQPHLPHRMSALGFSCMTTGDFQNEILNNFLSFLVYWLQPRTTCISWDRKDLGLVIKQPLGSGTEIISIVLGDFLTAYNCWPCQHEELGCSFLISEKIP